MKRLLLKIVLVLVSSLLIITCFLFYTTKGMGTAFENTYVAVFETKYNQLVSKKREPSVILVGGSNLAFGIDQYLLSEELKRPVINTGVHAGFNPIFMTQIVRQNVMKGDTVVLSLEASSYTDINAFTKIGANLVMQAIDSHISLYKYIPINMYPQVVDELIPFTELKVKMQRENKGCAANTVYTSCSFDNNGQMVFPRGDATIAEATIKEKNTISQKDLLTAQKNINYLKKLVKELNSKGVDVVLVAPAISKHSIMVSEDEYRNFYQTIADEIGATLIGEPIKYTFELEYTYDTVYHLNSKGEKFRSLKLATDLLEYYKTVK